MILDLVIMAMGMGGLFLGGNWLVEGASRLAHSLGISPLIVGLTIVALGTSAPELLVSLSAALTDSADISVGNVVGSNVANIGLILGVAGLVYPISVHITLLRREIPIMLGVLIGGYLLMRNGEISRLDGAVMIVGLAAFLGFLIASAWREQHTEHDDLPETQRDPHGDEVKRLREGVKLLVGMGVLMVGAQLTVQSAGDLARDAGVSELIIGVTLVALGTSLPELVASVMAALRKESDIAIGNIVGSNILNVLMILGFTSLIQPISVKQQIIDLDGLVMIGFGVLLLPFVIDRKLNRLEASAFLAAYVGYIVFTVLNDV